MKMITMGHLFILIAVVDVTFLIGFTLFWSIDHSIDDTVSDMTRLVIFISFRILTYVSLGIFLIQPDMLRLSFSFIVTVFFTDVFVLYATCEIGTVVLIIYGVIFVAIDLVNVVLLAALLAKEVDNVNNMSWYDNQWRNTTSTDPKENTEFIIVSLIAAAEGAFLTSYCIILPTVDFQVSEWFFLFHAMSLISAAAFLGEHNNPTAHSKNRLDLQITLYSVSFVLLIFDAVLLYTLGHHNRGGIKALRWLFFTCALLYVLVVGAFLQRITGVKRAILLFLSANYVIRPMIIAEIAFIGMYFIYVNSIRNPHVIWTVFIHAAEIFAAIFPLTSFSLPEFYQSMNVFVGIVICVLLYEIAMVTLIFRHDRPATDAVIEIVLLLFPFTYLVWYILVFPVSDLNDSVFDAYNKINNQMLLDKANMFSRTKKGLQTDAVADNLLRANILFYLIHEFISMVWAIEMVTFFVYVVAVVADATSTFNHQSWGIYWHLLHVLTLLSAWYVFRYKEEIEMQLDALLGVAIFLMVLDFIFLIDYYWLQWAGADYLPGFVVFKYAFFFIDVAYVVITAIAENETDTEVIEVYENDVKTTFDTLFQEESLYD